MGLKLHVFKSLLFVEEFWDYKWKRMLESSSLEILVLESDLFISDKIRKWDSLSYWN